MQALVSTLANPSSCGHFGCTAGDTAAGPKEKNAMSAEYPFILPDVLSPNMFSFKLGNNR
jgi:hypothetical protein